MNSQIMKSPTMTKNDDVALGQIAASLERIATALEGLLTIAAANDRTRRMPSLPVAVLPKFPPADKRFG